MILFTSIALIGGTEVGNDLYPAKTGMLIAAIVAVSFCVLGAVILMFYKEKKVMKIIAKEEDAEFLKAIESQKE